MPFLTRDENRPFFEHFEHFPKSEGGPILTGLAFHLVDSLNDRAYHAIAADMALKHLPASLAAAAMERIVPAWSAADQKTAAAWEASLPEQQAAFVRQHSSKPAELQE